jgi:hypothetical protein
MTPTGAVYTWGFGSMETRPDLLAVMNRYRIDTVIDLRRSASGLSKGAVDPHAAGALYAHARAGHRLLLVCNHPDPRRCHRHAEIALPIAQDAARYAAARVASPDALPITPILVRHIVDRKLVDPVELETRRGRS